MLRRWWRSLGFYWQVYIVMVISFGGIIAFVEGIAEPFFLTLLEERCRVDAASGEIILWIVSVIAPTLVLGFVMTHMVMRKMTKLLRMAKRLSTGDLAVRIETDGNERDVFAQMAGVFNDMAGSLERLRVHEKRLLADISHELRSPLTRMSLAVALLPAKHPPAEVAAMAELLDDEIDRMNTLVGMLLHHARDRLNEQAEYTRVRLSELAGKAVAAHSFAASADGQRIDATIGPDVLVWGHAVRLRMIFDNLLSNARFYAPKGESIVVRVGQNDGYVFVAVRDRGPGVPEKHLRDIFKAFFRVDQSRARTSGGVGLGLALARDAAIAMGGDIEARNANPGLEVTVTLPLPGHHNHHGQGHDAFR